MGRRWRPSDDDSAPPPQQRRWRPSDGGIGTIITEQSNAAGTRSAINKIKLVDQQVENAVDTQIALNQPVETYGEAARTRAVEAAGRAPTLRDVQELAPPSMTWTQMLERAQAASMKAQLENDRRQEAFARRIASGEASPRPGEPSWETAVRAAPPPGVLPDEVMRAIGPMGISGVQLQNTRSGDTVGQLAPDQHVDTSRLDSPWTKKLAPLALGSGSKVLQGLTQVARGVYDSEAPEGQRWMQGVPEKSQAVLGPNDYAEAVAGRAAEGGGVKSLAALIAEETTSKALAQAAKLAQAWNNLQWLSEAAGGIPVPNNPDQQEAKQWGEAARQLESGVMGETAGAQIPQEAKDEIAVDAAKVFGRTVGTAAEMKIPTEAVAVAPAVRAVGRPVAAAARGVHNALMDSSTKYQRMARLLSDAPSVSGLPPEIAAQFRMARNAEQAEPLLRQMETAKSIDEALSSSAWWSDVPAADRWRILLRTGTPESEAGKRGMAILSEAAQFEHSAMAQQAASREAQEALAAIAPTKVNVQRTAGMDVPQPFHPLWGQDFTKSATRIPTVIDEQPAALQFAQRADDVAASPYGKALASEEKIGSAEGERLANTEAARRMLKADVEQASPRMVKRLEEELSRSNLAGNVVASARETAARPGRVAAFRYIDDAMRSGVAEDFAPAGTAVKRYSRQATDRITLSTDDIKKLQQQNKVFLQVAGESDTVTDVLGRGDYHAVIRLPDGVDPALYHGKAVPRTLARALMEQAHGPGRTQEAAEAAADFMNKLMATKQVTNAMTVGRGGFQAANISNEVMRAIADEPDLFKGETPKLLARVLTAKDGEHIAELGMNARDARRVLIQGSGAGRGFASTMASTADEQATFTTGRIAADAARAAGLKRTGKAIDAASDALDAGVNAVTAPGRAMNDVVDEAFNSAMFGHTPGFKTEDNLRMALMLHKMQRGVRPEIAAQEVQRALINFGDTNALQRMGKTLIPFVNYYTKSIEGALYLSLRNPNQYRWLNRFVQAQEQADSVANARSGRSINAKFKSPDDALSFKALIQSGKDRNGNPVVMSVGGDTVPAEGAQLARALENTAGYMTGTATPEGSRDVLGMLNPVVAGALTAARGVDTASGRPVIPVDRKEEQRISAEARAAHPVLSAFNMPLAEAQWISEHPAENQAPLGATPNLYKMLLAATYTPGVGRLMAQPQAAMLGRWASGAPGNNPASMTDEARSSEYTRALMKLAGVKNATSVNVLDQAYADQLRSAKDLEKAAGLRLMNEKLKGKTVWRNP